MLQSAVHEALAPDVQVSKAAQLQESRIEEPRVERRDRRPARMPARFDSINSPLVREPVVSNGAPYIIDDDIVITGFSGMYGGAVA